MPTEKDTEIPESTFALQSYSVLKVRNGAIQRYRNFEVDVRDPDFERA